MIIVFKFLSCILILIFIIALSVPASAQNCLKYEPSRVRLQGKIFRKIFAGRPNYQSLKAGDEPETFWILHLSYPVCVENSRGREGKATYYDNETNVLRVQLVLTAKQYARWRALANWHTRVVVTGTLFHSLTGHHHTRVLLTVTDAESALP